MISEVIRSSLIEFGFTDENIDDLNYFVKELLIYNSKYNLISKSTEKEIWFRHVLDSAQLVNIINFSNMDSMADLGTGGGFPGVVLSIFSKNKNFHVKMFEKSPIKVKFLNKINEELNLGCEVIEGNVEHSNIDSKYVVARAFKKLSEILRISREIMKKPHKIVILKGKNAQEEINKALKIVKFKYRLVKSITDKESKIIIIDAE